MTSDQTPSDLGGWLPRLDSNQQPFGEQPPLDEVRPQPHDQAEHGYVYDHSRPESLGFNCGKTAADLEPYVDVRRYNVRRYNPLGWPAVVAALITLALVVGIVWWLA